MEKLKVVIPRPATNWRNFSVPPALFACVSAFVGGILLSGARILGVHIPAAVCLIAALGASLPAAFCYLGAVSGGLLLWPPETVLLTISAGFLTLVAAWAFRDLPMAKKPWLPVVTALCSGMLVGGMIFLASPITAKTVVALCLQIISLPLGTWAAQKILDKSVGSPLCPALFALVSGCGGILLPGGIPLGGILAAGSLFSLTGTALALPVAALTGLALDWSWQGSTSCASVFAAAAMAAGYLPFRKRGAKLLAFWFAAGLVLILSGGKGGALYPAVLLGSGIALFLPPFPVAEPDLSPTDAAGRKLRRAAGALDQVYRQLEDVPPPNKALEISDIFDKATGRVCTTCAGFGACWKQNPTQTRTCFLDASVRIFPRGVAQITDFSEDFRNQCRHLPSLCRAINDAIDEDAERRQRTHFRREMRGILSSQYRILSDYLRLSVLPQRKSREPLFRVDAACRAQGKSSVCGDRCASFTVGERHYLLLCDGMGTGTDAAVDSRRAMQLLTDLLRAGMDPDSALETLGALAILREDGGFSTVDLASVNLLTGEGILYKWGGGPSYLKTSEKTKKFGTASLPPGVGVGGTHQAQQIRLSLGRGEVLILTSDGVDGEDVQRLIQTAVNVQAEDLAAGILRCGTSEGEDDRSAAVLRLIPVSAR